MATIWQGKQSAPGNAISDEITPVSENKSDERPIWEIVAELGSNIPDEEWAKVPDDASGNYKYYLYGAPKRT